MNIVLCEYAEKKDFTAGNKARTDVVRILKEEEYKHIPLYKSRSNKILIFFQICVAYLKTFFEAGRGDNVFIQYPYYPAVVNNVLIKMLLLGRMIKHYTITMLIHDVIGLRSNEQGPVALKREVQQFSKLDKIICHTENMLRAFEENGGGENCVILGPFDYLYDNEVIQTKYEKIPTIIIAGNLSQDKCGYVYKLGEIHNCKFNLYGINYSGGISESIIYKGQFPSDELIEHLEGNFGLVWDGNSLQTCDGVYGEYLRFNSPHKFSLYVAAGIPLIVWTQSALASYVKSFGLGVCVDSLEDLSSLCISEEEYNQLLKNVLIYRQKIVHGNHLIQAIERTPESAI